MLAIRRICSQRGTSTLELIIALPILLFILFGIAEVSRLWHTLNIVTTAAREGARAGSVSGAAPGVAGARANEILAAANLTPAGAPTVNCDPCVPDSPVTVSVTVSYTTIFPLLLPMLAGPFPITQTASMRRE
ncbi:MAG TPA: TadE family protein [Methylomirabilota bacterium]|nr:TadE family protein [Methylomirabilota bacterium]